MEYKDALMVAFKYGYNVGRDYSEPSMEGGYKLSSTLIEKAKSTLTVEDFNDLYSIGYRIGSAELQELI